MKNNLPLRRIDRTKGVKGFGCGMCGKPVIPYRYSKKCDGWHWHKTCWAKFLTLGHKLAKEVELLADSVDFNAELYQLKAKV